jgi:hypothetical protein
METKPGRKYLLTIVYLGSMNQHSGPILKGKTLYYTPAQNPLGKNPCYISHMGIVL